MDIRINEVQSRVTAVDSQSVLDPRVMRQIVAACLQAIEDKQDRGKHLDSERRMDADDSGATRY
jgi:hypothetical protein